MPASVRATSMPRVPHGPRSRVWRAELALRRYRDLAPRPRINELCEVHWVRGRYDNRLSRVFSKKGSLSSDDHIAIQGGGVGCGPASLPGESPQVRGTPPRGSGHRNVEQDLLELVEPCNAIRLSSAEQ